MRKLTFVLLGVLLVLCVSLIDLLTKDFLVLELYLIPVAIVAWYAGRRSGVSMALLAAAATVCLDLIESPKHSSSLVHYWNGILNLVFFILVVYVLGFLKQTIIKLRSVTALKDNLTHMVVHDLRNPLSAVSCALQLFEKQAQLKGEADQEQSVKLSLAACNEMQRMISDILDISKSEEGGIQLKLEDFSLAEAARDVVTQLQLKAEIGEKRLSLEVPADLPLLRADQEFIRRVLANLIANALKFTPGKGWVAVKISFKPEENNFHIRVADSGRGIPKEYLGKVFDKFFQVASAAPHMGHGLGLTFCKMAVETHGGKIWAESEGPGKGTAITFIVPKECKGAA